MQKVGMGTSTCFLVVTHIAHAQWDTSEVPIGGWFGARIPKNSLGHSHLDTLYIQGGP